MSSVIEVQGLNYSYPDGKKALEDISFTIQNGEKIALVGPNGAGKSTLILHLNGILRGQGQIQVGEWQISEKTLPRVRSFVGLVFQNPDDQLFSPTVFDDVAYGPLYQGLPEEEIKQRVQNALHAVGMDDFSSRNSFHLSTGEKKRIAIATVLSMVPEVLVLDEPTAALDPRGRRELIELLKGMPQTMIIATHDMELVRLLTPRLIVLDAGKIAADGSTREMLADQKFLLQHGLI